MNIEAYLHRINHGGSLKPTYETLAALQEAHLLTVPFENLNISLGRPITTDEQALFHKIVEERRGGFCYELNGLFTILLRTLGYDVTLLSAGVARATGDFGPEYDHLTLLVHLEKPYLVDVGFGDSFHQPLLLQEAIEQHQGDQSYRLMRDSDYWLYQQQNDTSGWENHYRFTLQPHHITDFAEMCHYHQTSPDSGFTKRRVCTLKTNNGRITLSDMKLVTTVHRAKEERILSSQAEYNEVLLKSFGINLGS